MVLLPSRVYSTLGNGFRVLLGNPFHFSLGEDNNNEGLLEEKENTSKMVSVGKSTLKELLEGTLRQFCPKKI